MIVSSVTLEDAGIYKCRVDFKQSPTMTTSIELKIIEEPESPTIMDSEGSAVMGTVGPFRLKQPLILVCLQLKQISQIDSFFNHAKILRLILFWFMFFVQVVNLKYKLKQIQYHFHNLYKIRRSAKNTPCQIVA